MVYCDGSIQFWVNLINTHSHTQNALLDLTMLEVSRLLQLSAVTAKLTSSGGSQRPAASMPEPQLWSIGDGLAPRLLV